MEGYLFYCYCFIGLVFEVEEWMESLLFVLFGIFFKIYIDRLV